MKYFFLISLILLLLLSCNNAEQKQAESSTKTPVEVIPALDSIATPVAPEATVNADTLPAPPPKSATTPKVAPKKKPDNKAPTQSKKSSNNLAEKNSPQKVISNQYFEVTGGVYCNDDFSGNPRSPSCTNCRFCREVMVSVITEDTVYFKKMWMGGFVKNITSHTSKGGRGGLAGCVPDSQFPSPPPVPYQGQALISYTVGSPDAEIKYFDVTNLRKSCGKFYPHLKPMPKKNGPYK